MNTVSVLIDGKEIGKWASALDGPVCGFEFEDGGKDEVALEPTPKFEPGDVVRLKSGGPAMTVENVADNGEVNCTFFLGDDYYCHEFPEAMLYKSGADPFPVK